jgi:hypothetical protein
MALKYDFDIHSVLSEEIYANPHHNKVLREAGIDFEMAANKVALFRDQRTVDALRAAPERLRKLFLDSGFGLNRYDSGAPAGYYPARDEAARTHVIQLLTQNIQALPDQSEPQSKGGFNFGDFLTHLASTQPLDAAKSQRTVRRPTAAKGGADGGGLIFGLVVLGISGALAYALI